MSSSHELSIASPLWGIWLVMFLVIKLGGTALAGWSWLWVLLPIVPDAVVICQKLDLL